MLSIGNEQLSIGVNTLGAELASIRSAVSGTEYLWQGNPDIWSGQAPILFPIVGALKDGQFADNGKIYSLPRHGLARKSTFSVIDQSKNSLGLELLSTAESMQLFPWQFSLQVHYSLHDSLLNIEYRVKNTGDTPMRFTIGSHPAFNLTQSLEHYTVRFSATEEPVRFRLTEEGLLETTGTAYTLESYGTAATQGIRLSKHVFDDDALVFKNINSKHISLYCHDQALIKVHNGGAPHLGLWAKPGAPYVCIEPWFGYSDSTDASGQWQQKPEMLILNSNCQFEHQWAIEIMSVSG